MHSGLSIVTNQHPDDRHATTGFAVRGSIHFACVQRRRVSTTADTMPHCRGELFTHPSIESVMFQGTGTDFNDFTGTIDPERHPRIILWWHRQKLPRLYHIQILSGSSTFFHNFTRHFL